MVGTKSVDGLSGLLIGAMGAVLIILSATPAAAAPVGEAVVRQSLEGRVIAGDDASRPIVGAEVTVIELQRRTLTDRSGRFRVAQVPAGTYTLRIRAAGFAAVERRVAVGVAPPTELSIVLVPTAFELEEVIVTASPLGRAATYQPAQAFGREALQRRAATALGEMLDGEPGVAMRSFGSVPARPVLRGLDGDRVLVLENGERMGDLQEMAADHAIAADPLATDRVEVVRGPASLLYGSSALGGVVNLFTEDLLRQWSHGTAGNVAVQAATVNRLGAGMGRFRHGAQNWAATGRVSYRGAGDVRTPEGALPGTHTTLLTGSAGIGYAGGAFEGALTLDHHSNRYGIPEEPDDPDESVEIRMARTALQGRAGWRLGGLLEDVDLRFNASRFDQEEVEIEWQPGVGREEEVELEWLQHTLSSTLTARHAPLGIFDAGAVGFSVFLRDLEVGGEEPFMPNSRSTALALFAFQEAPLGGSLRLQFGGRFENQWIRPLPNEHFGAPGGERSRRTVSGAIGVNLQPRRGLEVGAQLARAHRTPSPRELFAAGPDLGAGTFEVGDPTLGSEIGHGLDAFARFTGAGARLEIAGFVNRIDDFIIFQPAGTVDPRSGLPIFRYESDNALFAGAEASLEALLTDAARARIGMDYVRGRRRDAVGTPLPFIPPLRARFGLLYDPSRWWFGGTTRLVGAQRRVAPEESPTPGYALHELDAGFRFDAAGRHTVALRLDNALNTAYRDHLSRVEDREFPMPGRNFNVVYRWIF
jgi:iron complex outermembrane recepter protein